MYFCLVETFRQKKYPMKEITIVRGDLKGKPVASSQLAAYFESVKTEHEGVLYLGYPIIGTADGGFQIDALLLVKDKGLVVFNIIEGIENGINYKDIQDENYTKLKSKFIQHKTLTNKRDLAFEIKTATFAPAWANAQSEEDYPCLTNESLSDFISEINWEKENYYEKTLSVLQSITTIRKNKSRDYVKKEDSRGAKLKRLEDSIANLDQQQGRAVIETVEGVQRIRGLAGSGKTIVLALKVAYLHAKNPDWHIAVTFSTRSLKAQFRKFIKLFSYEHINEEPNWEKIDIIHAWGNPKSSGIYYDICMEHDIEFLDLNAAKKITTTFGKEFDSVCKVVLTQIKEFKPKYDLVVVDEAQDFSKNFLRICYNILKTPKKLVYAYDELQSLNEEKTMDSPEAIFGHNEQGEPLVRLENEPNKPMQDIVLYKCYRNSREILSTAHALGFGIYRENLVQMFDNSKLWEDIGYVVEKGKLREGEDVTLKRTSGTSPDFLSAHSSIDDLLIFKTFKNNEEQINYIVNEIKKNIEEDELKPEDIMVINPNPLTTQKLVGAFREKLFEIGINSNLAGVSTSPDVFSITNTITFTGIRRAKGNEAAMVYIINAQYCFSGWELARKRNILFTAMTRSKAWVRVCGYGVSMQGLEDEFNKIKQNDFKLSFKYPTEEQREYINIVNRDMSAEDKKKIKESESNLSQLIKDIQEGRIKKEDLPEELIEEMKQVFY